MRHNLAALRSGLRDARHVFSQFPGSLVLPVSYCRVRAMSAFPESGRSDRQKLGENRVRFRPKAVIEKPRHEGGACDYRDDHIDSIVIVIVVMAG